MRRFLVTLMVLICFPAFSQENTTFVSGRFQQGSIIIHSRAIRAIEDSYPYGLQFDFGWHKKSEKDWNACNCYPKVGISLGVWNFDNPDVLGYGATGLFFLQPVFRADKKFSFSIRGGMGLSYQTKPHDPESNPDNLSYSTYLAFPLHLALAGHFRISDQWKADLQLEYNHISNGGMKQPNKGINWPTVSIGATRYFSPLVFPEREKHDWRMEAVDRNRTDITVFSTFQEPEESLVYLSGGLELRQLRRVGRISNISLGGEWMYDSYTAALSKGMEKDSGHHLGVAAGHEFILGKFLFSQQFGVYLLRPSARPEDVYQRYAFVYRLSQKFSTGVSLKAHGHVADFLDLRLGFSF